MEIEQIIIQAIPSVTCPVSQENVIARRVWLKSKIEELLKERDRSQPYQPPMEYKDGQTTVS